MSIAPEPTVVLDNRFARALPEMAVAWQAEATPAPRLLVLNEPLTAELGLDASWLRTPDGLGLLSGTVVPEGAKILMKSAVLGFLVYGTIKSIVPIVVHAAFLVCTFIEIDLGWPSTEGLDDT